MHKPHKWRDHITGRVEADITGFWMLSKMCLSSTKLWNAAIYRSRETWARTGLIPTGYDLQKQLQGSPWYRQLQSHSSQKAIHEVGEAYRSWFRLRRKDPNARPPGFRAPTELSTVTFDISGFRLQPRGRILLSLGPAMREDYSYPLKFLPLRISWWRPFRAKVSEVHIVPKDGYFEAHATEILPEPQWREYGKVMAIDLGVINPATITDTDGVSEIYKGGELLGILRYWNKEIARVQGELKRRTRGRRVWSAALRRMSRKASGQMNHAINALTSAITEECNKANAREVIVGDLKWIKRDVQTGKGKAWTDKASQKLNQFPLSKIVLQLRYKLARTGIRLVELDERGTSRRRCSLCGCADKGKLHRVHRGLFRCDACGTIMNADLNGARNILWRYLHQSGELPDEGSSGPLAGPRIRRWDSHRWVVV